MNIVHAATWQYFPMPMRTSDLQQGSAYLTSIRRTVRLLTYVLISSKEAVFMCRFDLQQRTISCAQLTYINGAVRMLPSDLQQGSRVHAHI